jgi:hypothetical protein
MAQLGVHLVQFNRPISQKHAHLTRMERPIWLVTHPFSLKSVTFAKKRRFSRPGAPVRRF